MADYNNIPKGLKLTTQIPLDVKTYVADEATLKYLGTNNNLAYTYYDGLRVFCIAERTNYEWREVQAGEENEGLVTFDFTYPAGLTAFGINYSNKKYNFFPFTFTGPAGTNGTNGTPGTNGADGADYTANNLQRTISTFGDSEYTLTDADNNYTLIIETGGTAKAIKVPNTGLSAKFAVAFIQKGAGDVTISGFPGGATINTPISGAFKIKGPNFFAYLEKEGTSNVYYIGGNIKV
jgi:hypothetical protein